jgi:hypothetical protein
MPDEKLPRLPLGEPMTAEELDKLAELGPGDLAEAKERWRQNSATAFRDLLDAERDTE